MANNKNAKSNICFDCQNAVCGCSWSRDFTPVPGWTAEKTVIRQIYVKGYEQDVETYHITACPQFVPDKGFNAFIEYPSTVKRPVKCLTTGVVYPSLYEASNQTGICRHGIRQVCKGNQASISGTVWRYVEGGEQIG